MPGDRRPPPSPLRGLPLATNRMYTVGANGIRLGRRERGAHRTARISLEQCEEAYENGPMVIEVQERRSERRRSCLGETNAARLLTFVIRSEEHTSELQSLR